MRLQFFYQMIGIRSILAERSERLKVCQFAIELLLVRIRPRGAIHMDLSYNHMRSSPGGITIYPPNAISLIQDGILQLFMGKGFS